MMAAGVNHLPVVDAGGAVVGVVSAGSLMTLDALSPFALRRSILRRATRRRWWRPRRACRSSSSTCWAPAWTRSTLRASSPC